MRPWDSLSDDEQRLFCRMAEVYAGFLSHTDHQIGRLLDYLEESGELDNTIIVLVSDNGASGEGGPNGSVNENKFFNGIPDTIEENLQYLDELGSPATYNHYPTGWAWAFNTPFKMWKRYNFEGGVADPLIVSLADGHRGARRAAPPVPHATDIVPTIYDCLGVEPPERVKGYKQIPIEGVSFRSTFDDATTRRRRRRRSSSRCSARARSGTRAGRPSPCTRRSPAGATSTSDRWELYHTDEDPTEMPRPRGRAARRSCRS